MVDLHHHLLPGLDDGSPDLETSVTMAKAAVADGITHIVCTPHASNRYVFDHELVAGKLAELRETLAAESVALTLAPGCDFHMSYDNVQDALAYPQRYTVNHATYLMIELADHAISHRMGETLHELRIHGMTPILTHPERNPTLQRDPARLADWMRNGLLTQVTCSSVLGDMGQRAEKMAHKMLADRWVHFLATDAHNLTSRPPLMSAARDWVAKHHGAEYAERLCLTNPMAVFEGRHLDEQYEPVGLYLDEDGKGKPWWKKMFAKKK